MTTRRELEIMGVERVRRAMVAFEHNGDCDGGARCCFLIHGFVGSEAVGHRTEALFEGKKHLTGSNGAIPLVESAFEGWLPRDGTAEYKGRKDLLAECVLFLAEHGTHPGPGRKPEEEEREAVPGQTEPPSEEDPEEAFEEDLDLDEETRIFLGDVL